jgi:HlyD family secretion protein
LRDNQVDKLMDQRVSPSKPQDFAAPDIAKTLSLDANGRAKPRGGRWKKWAALALVLAALFFGYRAWQQNQTVTVTYSSMPAAISDLVVEVSATGTLQPVTKVDVSSEQSGVVRAVNFEENQRVRKGDVLAELDTATLSAQVERAQASLLAAKARVKDAQTTAREKQQTLDRSGKLKARGMATAQDNDTASAASQRAENAIVSANADVAIAEAELKLQQAALAKATIYAPIDGIILTRSVDTGQTVAASLSAPVLFVIAQNLEQMQLEAAIDEADVGTVAKGQTASFTVDAYPDKKFTAVILGIAYASIKTDNIVTYEAKLDVDNKDLLLRPGMTANVEIVTREAKGALTVPNSAFRYQPVATAVAKKQPFSLTSMFMPRFPRGERKTIEVAKDGSRPVFVLRNGAPEKVSVKTGSTDGEKTEIISGLKAGDEIITAESPAAK